MEYREFIKKHDVPSGQVVPERLTFEDVVARAISRADLQEDVRGINASLESRQPGTSTPSSRPNMRYRSCGGGGRRAPLRERA
jgi:hypothetical protein